MSLPSTITVTISGTARVLSKINQDSYGSTYFLKISGGNELKLIVRHSYEGKVGPEQFERHNVEFISTSFAVDGTPTIRNVFITMRKKRSEDAAAVTTTTTGFLTWFNANIDALGGWES